MTGNSMNLLSTGALLTTRHKMKLRGKAGKERRVSLRVFEGAESIPSLRIAKFRLQCGVPGMFSFFPTLSARRSHQDLVDRSGHNVWE